MKLDIRQGKTRGYRWGLFHCPDCETAVEVKMSDGRKQITCGDCAKKRRPTSSTKHGMSHTKLHNIWVAMRQRCYRPSNKSYRWYGGKGIKICTEWITSTTFIRWAKENGYEEGLSIDRIDSSKDYAPENCRWLTKSENSMKGNYNG